MITRLKALRIERELTQLEVASLLGIHNAVISTMENRRLKRPPTGALEKLRKFYGKDWTWEELMALVDSKKTFKTSISP